MDITYSNKGFFTAFYAESIDGETALNQMMSQNQGSNKVPSIQANAVISQLRKLGYSVRKAKAVSSKQSDSDLLAALGV